MHVKENDRRWWLQDRPHEIIYSTVKSLIETDERQNRYELWRELYDDDDEHTGYEDYGLSRDQLTRDNLVANGCDTVHAKITKAEPRPYFLSIGGDWEAQERAELMTRWMDGEFERLDIDAMCDGVVMEAIKVGHGALHLYEDPTSHRPAAEIVFCEDLYVDPRESRYGKIRTMYRTMAVDMEVLAERYPQHAKRLEEVEPWEDLRSQRQGPKTPEDEVARMILVIESWRLPSRKFDEPMGDKPRQKDRHGRGRHVICVSDITLEDEEWSEDFFPIVEFCWASKGRKHWGTGLAQRLAGSQAELNRMSEIMYEAAGRCVPFLLVGPDFNAEQLDNDTFNAYRVNSPQDCVPVNPEPVGPIFLQLVKDRMQMAYAHNGISEMEARSQVPMNLESAKAINTYSDIASERFVRQGKAYERFRCGIAKRIVAIMERVVENAKEDGDTTYEDALVSLGGDRHGLELIKYTDARLADRPHVLRVFPVSKLSNQPAARLEEVMGLMQAGLVQGDDALELLDLPDLDRFNDVSRASRDDVRDAIQQCKRGKQPKAHSFMPLAYAIELGTQMYSLWHRKGAPQSVLDKLQAFVGHAQSLKARQDAALQAAAQPQPGPAAPMPAGPPPDMPPATPGAV